MPDPTLSQALAEAYAAAPVAEVIYHTLEVWHAAFAAPLRVVRDFADLTATLEASAPRNPGASVSFTAFAFDLRLPEVHTEGPPTLQIEIDNVGQELLGQIDLATSSITPISVIYRAFLASALTAGPQNSPVLALEVQSINVTPARITLECGFLDLTNRRFPGVDYGADVYPGLVP
jgi:Domain of unknown function (DUF1833)